MLHGPELAVKFLGQDPAAGPLILHLRTSRPTP